MQELQALVAVRYDVFLEILSKINPQQKLDTGSLLITSGVHPELGAVVLVDSPMGGRVLAVGQSRVKLVESLKP